MPITSAEQAADMVARSAAARRTAKIAGLIATAPPLTADQITSLRTLLDTHEVLPAKAAKHLETMPDSVRR